MPRAVGHAYGSNPINVVLPCHRLIGANGSLVKYGGGLQRKRWLLQHEGVGIARRRPARRGHSSRNSRCGFRPRMRRSVALRPEIAR